MRMPKTPFFLLPLIFLSLFFGAGLAQDRPQRTLSFEQAVELALKNYPAIRAAQAQRQAAEAGVDLARTTYLPRVDMTWQQNRATRNNVFGLLLPQSGIPSISGPQLDSVTQSSAWGSAGGLLMSWERIRDAVGRERSGGRRLPNSARRRSNP
jgi:outer membrane protein TolC